MTTNALGGLHHLTAVTGDAVANVTFYTRVLGLRLVKRSVNQDDVSAYHLFYGDEVGSPGTEVTFFDWPHAGPMRPGTGTIAATALAVPGRAALDYWARRLDEHGVAHGGVQERGGRELIAFADPEGQRLELVAADPRPEIRPWAESPVPADVAIRGLHAVTLVVRDLAPTERILTDVLGFRRAGEYRGAGGAPVVVFEVGPGGSGAEVHVAADPTAPRGRVGIGGVHHVAFRAADDAAHAAWRARVAEAGLGVTEVIDRYYFKSIYFREPGGVLYEIATDGPGFATDEDPAHLGERLALPPFLEPRRAEIEAGLRPLPSPAATAAG
jgi:glyoxalase family protein